MDTNVENNLSGSRQTAGTHHPATSMPRSTTPLLSYLRTNPLNIVGLAPAPPVARERTERRRYGSPSPLCSVRTFTYDPNRLSSLDAGAGQQVMELEGRDEDSLLECGTVGMA